MTTSLQAALGTAGEVGDDVIEVSHLTDGDPDLPANGLVLAVHSLDGKTIVVRCVTGTSGLGAAITATGYVGGEPVALDPITLGGQVHIAI